MRFGDGSFEMRVALRTRVLLLLFGGFGYGDRDSWGGYYSGGTGLLGALVVTFLVLLLIGAIHV